MNNRNYPPQFQVQLDSLDKKLADLAEVETDPLKQQHALQHLYLDAVESLVGARYSGDERVELETRIRLYDSLIEGIQRDETKRLQQEMGNPFMVAQFDNQLLHLARSKLSQYKP